MNRKDHKTIEEKAKQKRRTYKNQSRRYTALLSERPRDPHRKKWEANVAHFSKA